MAEITIKLDKVTGQVRLELKDKDIIQEMDERVAGFCQALLTDSKEFNEKEIFSDLFDYIRTYDRILYAPISSMIYACYKEHEAQEADKLIGIMNTNILALVNYAQGEEIAERVEKEKCEKKQKCLKDTKKVILKIWDHSNLAQFSIIALHH